MADLDTQAVARDGDVGGAVTPRYVVGGVARLIGDALPEGVVHVERHLGVRHGDLRIEVGIEPRTRHVYGEGLAGHRHGVHHQRGVGAQVVQVHLLHARGAEGEGGSHRRPAQSVCYRLSHLHRSLEFIGIGYHGDDGQDADFLEHRYVPPVRRRHISTLARHRVEYPPPPLALIDQEGIHPAIYIIYTDAPNAHPPPLLRAIDIDAEVEAVVGGQAVVVPPGIIIEARPAAPKPIVESLIIAIIIAEENIPVRHGIQRLGGAVVLQGEGHAVARGVGPRRRQLHPLGKAVGEDDVQLVAVVVLGGEAAPAVNLVEPPVGPREGVGQPTREAPRRLACHQLHAVRAPLAHRHLLLPRHGGGQEGIAVLVVEQVEHPLVVALDGEAVALPDIVVNPGGHLVADEGPQPARHRHPRVGGQVDVAIAQQVDVLPHPGIGGFQAQVVAQEPPCREARLQQGVGRPLDVEQAEPQPGVQAEGVGEGPIVLGEERRLAGPQQGVGIQAAREEVRPLVRPGRTCLAPLGAEAMQQEIAPETHAVRRGGTVVELGADAHVEDGARVARLRPGGGVRLAILGAVDVASLGLDPGMIAGGEPRYPPVEAAVELIGPPDGRHQVAPAQRGVRSVRVGHGLLGQVVFLAPAFQHVAAVVEAEEEPAPLAEAVVQLQVEVVEGVAEGIFIAVLLVQGVDDGEGGSRHEVRPRAAQGYLEGGAVPHDRPFEAEPARQQADSGAAVVLAHIPLPRMHVDHRGKASAVACREARLEEVHPPDRLRVEGGEEAS